MNTCLLVSCALAAATVAFALWIILTMKKPKEGFVAKNNLTEQDVLDVIRTENAIGLPDDIKKKQLEAINYFMGSKFKDYYLKNQTESSRFKRNLECTGKEGDNQIKKYRNTTLENCVNMSNVTAGCKIMQFFHNSSRSKMLKKDVGDCVLKTTCNAFQKSNKNWLNNNWSIYIPKK